MPSFYVKVLPLFRLISPHHLSTRPIQDSKSSLSLNVDLGTGQLVGPKKKLSAAYHPQVIYNDQDFIFLSHLAGSWHDMFSLKTSLRPICWPLVLTRVGNTHVTCHVGVPSCGQCHRNTFSYLISHPYYF
jgi:hypothetical protein